MEDSVGPRFRQPSIPAALADEVERILRDNEWLGYKSLSSFTQAAVRKEILEVQRQAYQRRVLQSGNETIERSVAATNHVDYPRR